MTITLTPLSKNQYKKVGIAVLYIAISIGISVVVALLTRNKNFLALTPVLNIVGVFGTKVFEQDADADLAGLPEGDRQVIQNAQTEADTLTAGVVGPLAPNPVLPDNTTN
jgi:hypothetical protein